MRSNARDVLRSEGLSKRRVGFGLTAEAARLVPSLVTFIVVPRALGAGRYGELAAAIGLTALFAALATTGAHIILIRNLTVRDVRGHEAVAQAFTTSLLGGAVGLLVGVPLAAALFNHLSVLMLVALFAAELLFGNLLHVFSAVAIAREDQRTLALLVVIFAGARVVATVVYALSPLRGSLAGFALLYLAAVMCASAACAAVERRRNTWPGFRIAFPKRRDVSNGLSISSTAAVFYVQDGLDTPIIVRSGFATDAGAYASAYRVVSLMFAPINALVLIGLPRLAANGDADAARDRRTAVRLTAVAVVYGLVVFGVTVVAAPLVPVVIGRDFGHAVEILRWLALLPLLRGAQYFVANNLMLNGEQRGRLLAQLVSAVVSVVAYLVLIPRYSWKGAVAGTYMSEVALAIGLWAVFMGRARLGRAQKREVAGALAA